MAFPASAKSPDLLAPAIIPEERIFSIKKLSISIFTCHGGKEDANDEREGCPDIDNDVIVGLLPSKVVLSLVEAVADDVPLVMVGVPHRVLEGPAHDPFDAAPLLHYVVLEVLVALVIVRRGLVLHLIDRVILPDAELVPYLLGVYGVLGAVGHLGHQPRPHHADVGLVVAIGVVGDPREHTHDGAENADQGDPGKLVDDLHPEEDDSPHDEEKY